MTDGDVQRDLGRMEAQIKSLTKQLEALTETVARLDRTLSEARGGWKMLIAVAGLAGVIGAGIAKLIAYIPIR